MTSLRRTLGLWQVSISGIGIILGAGVYALVGPAAGLAGNALWAAFLLAALAAGLTAYSYARLGCDAAEGLARSSSTRRSRSDRGSASWRAG